MNKYKLLAASALTLMLAACGDDAETKSSSADSKTIQAEKEETATKQTITYLGKDYEVPGKITNIVAASLEAMEDSVALGIKPVGVISTNGTDIPSYLAKDLTGATVVGSKKEPSAEAMLALNPDVILGTSKFDEAQMQKFNTVATSFPYSHFSTNWKENLTLLGQLANKEKEAAEAISNYERLLGEAKEKIATSEIKNQDVLIIRVRGGLAVYPETVYFNPSLYEELGLKVPASLAALEAKVETKITYETLAEWNPDVILLQFAEDENTENPELLDEILGNSIFKSTKAAKNDKVFVNIVDPLAQGGTAWSKINFLEAFNKKVLK